MTNDEQKALGKFIARTWADDGFKAKLLADPAAVLQAEGIAIPAGVSVKVVENTDKVLNLVLPAKPEDLSDEQLDNVAGGGICILACCACV